MAVTAVVFDVGETLVDETRAWRHAARHGGVPEFTLMGVVGGLATRGQDHRGAFELLGFAAPGLPDVALDDFYPDAVPCLAQIDSLDELPAVLPGRRLDGARQVAEAPAWPAPERG